MKIILRILIFVLLFICFVFTAWHFGQLPDEIPIHYNAKGEADDFSSKDSIWFLPILGSILIAIMYAIVGYAKFPTPTKKLPPYFIELVSIYILLIFTYIQIATVLIAMETLQDLGTWFLPFIIIASLLLAGYAITASGKN